MQLGLLMAVVAAIIVSENAPRVPVSSAYWRFLLAVISAVCVVAFAVAASVTTSRAIHQDAEKRHTCLQFFGNLKRIHLTLWLTATVVIIYVLNWPQLVRYNWGLDHAILIRDLLVLAPVWLPLLLSWAAFYDVEHAVYQATHGCGSGLSVTAQSPFTPRRRFVWLQTRHYLGLCILPVLLLLTFQDTLALWVPNWQNESYAWLLYLLPLAALTAVFPYLLSRIWQTSTLPEGPLRTRLADLAARMGVCCRDFKIWQTDRQMLNAAVAGLVPSIRYVFVTDAILQYLRDDELESVVAHELGHVRRHHLLLRLLLLGLPIWVLGILQTFSPSLLGHWSGLVTGLPTGLDSTKCLATAALALSYAVLALGRYSRLLEHDADLCVLDAGLGEEFISTIDRLSYLCGDRRGKSSWLHPSTVSRIHLLRRALHEPLVADRFRRQVRLVNGALLAAWLAVPVMALLA